MAIFRAKDKVPEIYVSESRDFQLLLRVLDFVQNSLKYNIDTMICSLSTEDIPGEYLERLKSKLGFYTIQQYDDDTLRLALSVFPFIIRYKGSREGIVRCVNAYLKYLGVRVGYKLDIYNEHTVYPYTVRIGINTSIKTTALLEDLLSYILPTGYFVEIYFYKNNNIGPTEMEYVENFEFIVPSEIDNTSVRSKLEDVLKNTTVSTTQLGMVFDPTNTSVEQ